MPSLALTAVALPIALTLLLLPPLVQYHASLPAHLSATHPGLRDTLLSFFRPSSLHHSSISIWTRLDHAAHPLVSRFVSIALTPTQRQSILDFDRCFPDLLASCGLAVLGLWATSLAIQGTKDVFKQRGFKGKDLLKSRQLEELPETMGLPAASVYMALLFLFIPFRYFTSPTSQAGHSAAAAGFGLDPGPLKDPIGWEGRMDGKRDFPHHELASYLSALLTFLCAIVLGFLDDVFDIRWRYKLPIPIIASIPLLMIYYAGGGGTTVVMPSWPESLRAWLGTSIIDLGPLYYVYMSLLSTFCTNSINILAGINGVEVGQALVICISLCINSLLYLDPRAGLPGSFASEELLRRHLFSLYFLLPLSGVCLGLLAWNRYPARVFVGDTFCYFAGMVFSAVGILGHFSKTLLLFFAPQIFNFLLSCPQLFGLVPNPRHRVPRFDASTNSLYPSITEFSDGTTLPLRTEGKGVVVVASQPKKVASGSTVVILRLLEAARLVQLEWHHPPSSSSSSSSSSPRGRGKRRLKSTTNLTLLNAILVFRGVRHRPSSSTTTIAPVHVGVGVDTGKINDDGARPYTGPSISELGLWYHVMAVQALGSLLAFAVRYRVAALVFPTS
ncbi:uncharacterized protein PFL1_01254 [Pseudozyma flocculosa PF-1]|uniref:UDP-N-acetylglucosamine--dolichyl-phosphate N-acetylglucosaminephosphotransferase n=1 Tax=Pseudozyma flocculosa TaxID=84751 RepID=A0A5C3EU89_9BASI|nr:uncharacterized protein PFL1_01254 [Pseudozyma flocculosa PF-1]EPQ31065.1 hypothetical protein PFL1_01254 [Pseudozyma flocculosa PF-1]SPO35914.1 related to ALG7 -UDP-N-acetylglucosamine-1-phosphate transferase [Pseudozyma flocculosa]